MTDKQHTSDTPAAYVPTWENIATDNLTSKQAGNWANRSDATMKRWRRMRIGPPFFTVNGRVLYSKRQLQEWIESCRRQSQEAA